jgi:hypothetical protein
VEVDALVHPAVAERQLEQRREVEGEQGAAEQHPGDDRVGDRPHGRMVEQPGQGPLRGRAARLQGERDRRREREQDRGDHPEQDVLHGVEREEDHVVAAEARLRRDDDGQQAEPEAHRSGP